jgi:hypothetical protein
MTAPSTADLQADAIERIVNSDTLVELAVGYAQLGWRVHPCRPREKLPLLKDWPAKATTDAPTIWAWWQQWPDANVSVATGPESGLLVLDVDGDLGEAALARLERKHGPLPDFAPLQMTGGGGWQVLFDWPEDRIIRNSVGRLGPKLDIKATGGACLLPPSIHPSGQRYRWAEGRSPWDIVFSPAPDWLLDILDPPITPEPERPTFSANNYSPRDDRYCARALETELALVAVAPRGRRNNQLNASAHALFRFAQDGRLDAGVIQRGLLAAAQSAGLHEREALATIGSAAKARGIGR